MSSLHEYPHPANVAFAELVTDVCTLLGQEKPARAFALIPKGNGHVLRHITLRCPIDPNGVNFAGETVILPDELPDLLPAIRRLCPDGREGEIAISHSYLNDKEQNPYPRSVLCRWTLFSPRIGAQTSTRDYYEWHCIAP